MALLWSAGVFAIYLANGREIWSGDSVPAKYLTCAVVRGDGFYLDRYRDDVLKWWPHPGMPYYVTMVDGHYVSRYPLGPVFVALPFTLPQIWLLDRTHPGWETSDPLWFDTIAKRSAAAIATLTAFALLTVLLKLGLGREAWLAATAAALGSNLWCTASQSLWQHGPAALMLTLLSLLLLPEAPSAVRFVLAGLAAGLLVCSRPIDLAFAVTTAVWVTIRHPRQLVWFLSPAVVLGAALIGYNRAFLGAAGGYYSNLDAATFATPWLEGLQGTLLSPSRGLFVFSPWTLIAFAYLPFAFFQLRRATLIALAARDPGSPFALDFDLFVLVGRALFRAAVLDRGHPVARDCSGPGTGLGQGSLPARLRGFPRPDCGLDRRSVPGRRGISERVEEEDPPGIDGDTHRLWDWSDNELSRCIVVSKPYRALFGPAEAEVPIDK